MKAKKILLSFLLCVVLASTIILTACDNGSTNCAHDWDDWSIVTAATCQATGSESRECKLCDKTETRNTSKSVHKMSGYVSNDDATCTADGTKTAVCENSGCTESITKADDGTRLAHKYRDSTVAATCTTDGSTTSTCEYCGDESTNTITMLGHDFVSYTTNSDATCDRDGTKTATCAHDGCTQTNVITDIGSKLNHQYTSEPIAATCVTAGTTAAVCILCDHTLGKDIAPLGHDYQIKTTLLATCTVDGGVTYECKRAGCDEEYTASTAALGHDVNNWQVSDGISTFAATASCDVGQTLEGECERCHETVSKNATVTKHTYKAAITTEATCTTKGVKTFTCQNNGCNDTYTEEYDYAGAHKWNDGVADGNVTTYSCQNDGCVATKKTVSAKTEKEVVATKETLTAASEVELATASIALDTETLSAIDAKNVKLSADTLTQDQQETALAGLSDEEKEQIGDNKIYNFTMTADDNAVTKFGGKVTVKIPYELAEGEDVESIAIWYINDSGEVEAIKATYSSGFAIFETDHFSYYTVTKLEHAQRCKLYGHSNKDTVVAATCVSNGYTISACQRCGKTEINNKTAATGHEYETTTVKATCTTKGSEKRECKKCNYTLTTITPATGHNLVETNKTNPTCTTNGSVVTKCDNENCNVSYTQEIAKLGHDYKSTVTAPTCDSAGYTKHKCSRCDDEYTNNEKPALGHTWDISAPTCVQGQVCTVCNASGAAATGNHNIVDGICTVCKDGCTHNYVDTVTQPTCTEGGYTIRECTVCHLSSSIDSTPALGHTDEFSCDRCGSGTFDDGYFTGIIKSVLAGGYVLVLEDFQLEIYYNDEVNTLTFMELSLCYDSVNGQIKGYGYFEGDMIGEIQNGYAAIEGDRLYLSLYGDGEGNKRAHEQYISVPLDYVFDANGTQWSVNEISDMLFGNILPALDKVIDEYSDLINTVINSFIKSHLGYEKIDGNYKFSLSKADIVALYSVLNTDTVAKVLEDSTGLSFADMKEKVTAFLDITPAGIKALQDFGFDMDYITTIADLLFASMTGSGGMFDEIMSNPDYADFTLLQIIEGMTGSENAAEMIAQTLAGFEEMTAMEFLAGVTGATIEFLDEYATKFIDSITADSVINIICDAQGNILSMGGTIGYNDEWLGSGEARLKKDYTSEKDYTAFTSKAKSETTFHEEELIAHLEEKGYVFTKNADGTLSYIYNVDKEYENGTWDDDEYIYTMYHYEKYTDEGTYIPGYTMMSGRCGDKVGISYLENKRTYDVSRGDYQITENKKTGETTREDMKTSEPGGSGDWYISGNMLIYNTATKKFVLSDSWSLHNYQYDESKSTSAHRCGEKCIDYYECADCGDHYTSIYTKGHTYNKDVYQLKGESCEDGVDVYMECDDCGEKQFAYSMNEHKTHSSEIDFAGYDVCTHHVVSVQSCSCGQEYSIQLHEGMKAEPVDGGWTHSYECSECTLTFEHIQLTQKTGCVTQESSTYTVTATENGTKKTLISKTVNSTKESHDYFTMLRLADEAKSCREGVIVSSECRTCQNTKTENIDYHMHGYVEFCDLTQYGAAEGKVYSYGCACGQEEGKTEISLGLYQYTETNLEIDGQFRQVYTLKADGFAMYVAGEEVKAGCDVTTTYYLRMGKNIAEGHTNEIELYAITNKVHENVRESVQLQPGGKTCTDGVVITGYCDDCKNIVHTREENGHYEGYAGEIDLAECGSTCGGKIINYACACGEKVHSDIQAECEFEHQYKGDNETWLVCPVTDPVECGFTIKQTYEKVDNNSCTAYRILYVGYQRESETKGESLHRLVDMSRSTPMHAEYTTSDYESTDYAGYAEHSVLCARCGSGRIDIIDKNGKNAGYIEIDNTQDYTNKVVYWFYNGGKGYLIYQRHDNYANGDWSESTYEYNFEGVCQRTVTSTSSHGKDEEPRIENACHVMDYDGTCTQVGGVICTVCHNTESSSWPNGHNWVHYKEGTGKEGWYCASCYLESAVGAVGIIDFEDLGDRYNDDSNYYIGFFNRAGYKYDYVVSIVLHDENNTNVITTVMAEHFTDTIVTINKQAVADWAKTNGYEGKTYDIRLTFVPQDYNDDCDYAITLTE